MSTGTVAAPKSEKVDAKTKDAKDAAAAAAQAANDRLKAIVSDLVSAFADQGTALKSIQGIPASDKLEEILESFNDATTRIAGCRDRLVKMTQSPTDKGAYVTLVIGGERLVNESTGSTSWSPQSVLSTLVRQQKVRWSKVITK